MCPRGASRSPSRSFSRSASNWYGRPDSAATDRNPTMLTRHRPMAASPRSQRGAAIVLIVIALLALLLMAGLALDGGHLMLNKTRLQNAVDAAALAGAKTLDETGNTGSATTQALQAFANNA